MNTPPSDDGPVEARPANVPRVDWTFPIWPIVVFVLHAATIVWWGATIQERVSRLEEYVNELKPVPAYLGKLDERTLSIREDVRDIKRQVFTAR